MSATTTNNTVWGVHEPREIKGLPPHSKARLRMRNDAFAIVYAKTSTGIRSWVVAEKDGEWWAEYEQGANITQ